MILNRLFIHIEKEDVEAERMQREAEHLQERRANYERMQNEQFVGIFAEEIFDKMLGKICAETAFEAQKTQEATDNWTLGILAKAINLEKNSKKSVDALANIIRPLFYDRTLAEKVQFGFIDQKEPPKGQVSYPNEKSTYQSKLKEMDQRKNDSQNILTLDPSAETVFQPPINKDLLKIEKDYWANVLFIE